MRKKDEICPRCGERLRWETRGARQVGWCTCNLHGPVVNRPVVNRPVVNRPVVNRPKVNQTVSNRLQKKAYVEAVETKTKPKQEANE